MAISKSIFKHYGPCLLVAYQEHYLRRKIRDMNNLRDGIDAGTKTVMPEMLRRMLGEGVFRFVVCSVTRASDVDLH
jgi:hypothetical protein